MKSFISPPGRPCNLIAGVADCQGVHVTDRQGIADLFADFYEELYMSRAHGPQQETIQEQVQEIVPFSIDELRNVLEDLENGKGKDGKGGKGGRRGRRAKGGGRK